MAQEERKLRRLSISTDLPPQKPPSRDSILLLRTKDKKESLTTTQTTIPSESTINIKLQNFEAQFRRLTKEKNTQTLSTKLAELHLSISNLLYTIHYSGMNQHIEKANTLLREIEPFLLSEEDNETAPLALPASNPIETDTPSPKPMTPSDPVSRPELKKVSLEAQVTSPLDELPLDIQAYAAEFLTVNDLLSTSPKQDQKFLHKIIHFLSEQTPPTEPKDELALFWTTRAQEIYDLTFKKEDIKPDDLAEFKRIHAAELTQLKKHFSQKETLAPFKSIEDIQRFLIAIREGDRYVLLKEYYDLDFGAINTLLTGQLHPIYILNLKLNQTGQEKYKDMLAIIYRMYLRSLGDFTDPTTKEIQFNFNLENNIRQTEEDKNSEILRMTIACRQQHLLLTSGYSYQDLSFYLNSMLIAAIIAGNIDVCDAILATGYDITDRLFDVNNDNPLSYAIKLNQFKVANIFYDNLFERQKNSYLAEGLSEEKAVEKTHYSLFVHYINSELTLSKGHLSSFLQFMSQRNHSEAQSIYEEYIAIYNQFIDAIIEINPGRITEAMQKFQTFFAQKNLPNEEDLPKSWIRDRYHFELGGGSIIEYIASLPPQQALQCIQPFVEILAISDGTHNVYTSYKSTITDGLNTLDAACGTALQHTDTSFVDFIASQFPNGFSSFSENQRIQVLLVALLTNNTDKIKTFCLGHPYIDIQKALEFAIIKDQKQPKESQIALTCLKNYLDFLKAAKMPQTKYVQHLDALFNSVVSIGNLEMVTFLLNAGRNPKNRKQNAFQLTYENRKPLLALYKRAIDEENIEAATALHVFLKHACISMKEVASTLISPPKDDKQKSISSTFKERQVDISELEKQHATMKLCHLMTKLSQPSEKKNSTAIIQKIHDLITHYQFGKLKDKNLLATAAKTGNLPLVKLIIKHWEKLKNACPHNALDEAVVWASQNNQKEIAKALLSLELRLPGISATSSVRFSFGSIPQAAAQSQSSKTTTSSPKKS